MTSQPARRDLITRADVEALLRQFYGRVLLDDVLAGPFVDIRERGLESHLPVMCDFWETMLFRAGLYKGSALRVHQPVHDQHRLCASQFLRWLTLWDDTVDEMFDGPVAQHAKLQAARIARAMHHRLTAKESLELDDIVRQGLPNSLRRRSGSGPSGQSGAAPLAAVPVPQPRAEASRR